MKDIIEKYCEDFNSRGNNKYCYRSANTCRNIYFNYCDVDNMAYMSIESNGNNLYALRFTQPESLEKFFKSLE
jgi:hypothetical protein